MDASIIVESARDVLTVPTEAIKTVGDKSYVFVKDDGRNNNNEKGKHDENSSVKDFPNGKPNEKENNQNADGKDKE